LYFKEKDNLRTMETNSVVFFRNQRYSNLPDPPIIAVWQIINPENVGSLVRLADNLGSHEVFVLGEDFHLRMSSIKKTAGLSFNNVRLIFISADDFFAQISPEYHLVALETCDDSENLFFQELPEKIVFLLGNERNGLPEEILGKCENKVHIPMTGKCKSMNISHALAVALFEWQRQMLFQTSPERG